MSEDKLSKRERERERERDKACKSKAFFSRGTLDGDDKRRRRKFDELSLHPFENVSSGRSSSSLLLLRSRAAREDDDMPTSTRSQHDNRSESGLFSCSGRRF